jgi:hypothetical protein
VAARQEAVGPAALELPLEMPAVTLTNPELGLVSLAFGGAAVLVSTVVDAADARLLRAGGLLVRAPALAAADASEDAAPKPDRWELAIPEWLGGATWTATAEPAPAGPAGQNGRAGQNGDVVPVRTPVPPAELAENLVPLIRDAQLVELATRSVKRSRWLIRGEKGTAAVLVDDTVTLRRHEIAVARYREATIDPVSCSARALAWLCDALESAGATLLDEPVPLPVRLGAPATGLPDLPDPDVVAPGDPAAIVFAALVRTDARALWTADLAVRTGGAHSVSTLHRAVVDLVSDLRVFGGMLDADVTAEVVNDLDWLDDQLADVRDLGVLRRRLADEPEEFGRLDDVLAGHETAARKRLVATLGLPRYRRMLDGLVRLVRNPGAALKRDEQTLARAATQPAVSWLEDAFTGTIASMAKWLKRAGSSGRDVWAAWREVQVQAAALEVLGRAAVLVGSPDAVAYAKSTRKLRRKTDRVAAAARCSWGMRELALRGSAPDPAVVFALGQASAVSGSEATDGVRGMIDDFPDRRRKLTRKAVAS